MVIPLAPDLYSLQGLKNLGPTLRRWRNEWSERHARNPVGGLSIPAGDMTPAGYILMQHAVRLDRPVKAYDRWMARIPAAYREAVLAERDLVDVPAVNADPQCLAALNTTAASCRLPKRRTSPMFALRPADGAIGGHAARCRIATGIFGAWPNALRNAAKSACHDLEEETYRSRPAVRRHQGRLGAGKSIRHGHPAHPAPLVGTRGGARWYPGQEK